MTTYVVVAYKHGKRNGHHYFVAAGTSRDAMLAAARDEHEERGGKYGVLMLAFPDGPDEDAPGGEYLPSYAGETALFEDWFDEACKAVGWEVFEALDKGSVLLPSDELDGTLKETPVALPQWLRDVAENARADYSEDEEDEEDDEDEAYGEDQDEDDDGEDAPPHRDDAPDEGRR